MKLTIKTTKRFDKDLKKLKKRQYDLTLLAQIINKLSDMKFCLKNIEIIILLAIIKDLENVIFSLTGF